LKIKADSLPKEPDDEFVKFIEDKNIVELDVRPIIDSGKDPFADIIKKVKTLKEGELFLLINSFEPIPLYTVLEKRRLNHKSIKKEDVFYIYFYKNESLINYIDNTNGEDRNSSENIDERENIVEIDVREMVPPEPMIKILETLSKIDDKTVLIVHHHREPLMLYPKLEERGYKAISNKIKENYYKVVIIKNGISHNE